VAHDQDHKGEGVPVPLQERVGAGAPAKQVRPVLGADRKIHGQGNQENHRKRESTV